MICLIMISFTFNVLATNGDKGKKNEDSEAVTEAYYGEGAAGLTDYVRANKVSMTIRFNLNP